MSSELAPPRYPTPPLDEEPVHVPEPAAKVPEKDAALDTLTAMVAEVRDSVLALGYQFQAQQQHCGRGASSKLLSAPPEVEEGTHTSTDHQSGNKQNETH